MNKLKYKYFCMSIFKWLTNRVNPDRKLSSYLEGLLEKLFVVFTTRGASGVISFCKESRASLYRALARYTQEDFSLIDRELPRHLKFISKCPVGYRVPLLKLLLTILNISRALRVKPSPSFSSITGPSTMKEYPFLKRDFKEFWHALGYSSKLKPVKSLDFKNYHKSSKSGPNGPALWYSISDLISLDINMIYHIGVLGGEKLKKYLRLLRRYSTILSSYLNNHKGIIRKLIYFSDREGKTREVAIFDYFSQTSLIPLHNYLFKVLRRIPQDYTFDQTGFMKTLEGSEVFYSIDLTAFTDRFPIILNRDLLEERIGPFRANSWFQIMTQEFSMPDGSFISYQVGNPMGAYSSWNSTTLAHHFVVWKACKNKRISWKTLPYAMLGDDLVIGNRLVALEYCRLIRTLGVHWSKEKTHVSPHFFEFAKRIHWCGEDISPFPIAGLWSERNRLVGQVQVLENAVSKGWFSATECIESLDEYFRYFSIPKRRRTKWVEEMTNVWRIISILQKKASALELIPFVEKISPVVASLLDEKKILSILIGSIMLTFVDSSSNILDKSKHKDTLGQLAVDISVFLTSFMLEPGFEDAIDLPESLPHTHVWGVVSEDYLRAHDEARIIDTTRSGNWDPLLKNLKVPISDESFYFGRKADLLYIHSSEILSKFRESIKDFAVYPHLIG